VGVLPWRLPEEWIAAIADAKPWWIAQWHVGIQTAAQSMTMRTALVRRFHACEPSLAGSVVAHGGRFVSFPSASKASTPFDFQDWTLEIRPDGVTFASFGLSQVTTLVRDQYTLWAYNADPAGGW